MFRIQRPSCSKKVCPKLIALSCFYYNLLKFLYKTIIFKYVVARIRNYVKPWKFICWMLLHSIITLHLATVKINIAWSFTIFRKLLFIFKHFLSHIQTQTHICTHSLSHVHKHVFSFTCSLYRTHAYVLYISHSKK